MRRMKVFSDVFSQKVALMIEGVKNFKKYKGNNNGGKYE